MKRREALSVGQIIEQAMAQSGNRDNYERQQACYLWAEAVGPTVSKYTTRRWVDRDVLHVCITSAPLKNELSFCLDSIIRTINKMVGKDVISKIVIH